MIDLVIFDCDGVLVDSEILAARAVCDVLADLARPMPVRTVLAELVGLDGPASRLRLEALHDALLPADFEQRVASRLGEAFAELRPVEGIASLLAGLELPYCVASNSEHARLERAFAVTGLSPLLRCPVFSADDVARGKPAPDLLLHAARSAGPVAPARCLVIEDSVSGVTAARAAGMRVIGFCGASHIAPGHGGRLMQLGAEHVLTTHHEIAAFIRAETSGRA